ncbi:MAG: hypothetical protein K2M73_03170 [Lachnospiraceae bacterium]|nr:hypothetical protein [Lachnospiraceae bacterium]
MIVLIDRIVLLLFGMVSINMNYSIYNDKIVVYVLIGILVLCISYIFSLVKLKYIELIFYLALIFFALYCSDIIVFFGIILYALVLQYMEDKKYLYGLLLSVICVSVYVMLNNDFLNNVFTVLTYILSIIMAVKTQKLIDKNNALKVVRDDGIEKNNILSEKNRYLHENQENEIYIAILSERNRIAREIHDNVGHLLSRSILQVGACIAVNKNNPVEKMLLPIKETLDEAMNSIRESVHDLHKESFDLKQAAETILSDIKQFEVKFDYDISQNADKDIKYVLLTILKEATTNISKYSDGDKVIVIMRELENYYQMVIEDNGKKIKDEYKKSKKSVDYGIGLINMEDRVKNLSGLINFSYENGFRIFISIPKEVRR